MKSRAAGWRAALGPRQVLVKAAGNSGTDYSAGFNQLATATDDDGALLLNRQMLIVGNWDAASQTIIGNRAGNVCTTWRNGTCLDAATISDSFIMAPGTDVSSTYPGGGYASMTGTSMAAPVVSAALALLRQNWPHLDGNQLASILLETADKSIPGYQEHIHGQGLLDMDRATQPVGETGFPLGASVSEARVPMAGGGAMAGISATAGAALSGVMLLDGYERDFYVDLAGGLVQLDRAEMRYRLPVARGAGGDVSYDSRQVDFSPARRETDVGLFFRRGWLGGTLSSESFVEWRHDAPHGGGEVLVETGVRLRMAL